jgi:Flp pilus assembly pilin Flp
MLKVLAHLTTLVCRDDRGVTAVEYALLLLFVAAALVVSLKIWGAALAGMFNTAATDI